MHFRLRFDWFLVIGATLLCTIGLSLIYSASYHQSQGEFGTVYKQMFSLCLGFIAYFAVSSMKPNTLKSLAYPLLILASLLLLAVILKGVVAGGSRRWLDLSGFKLQPSEISKIGLIMGLSLLFSSRTDSEYLSLGTLSWGMVLTLIPAGLIIDQPDLGTASIHCLIAGLIMLMAGVKKKMLLLLLVLACLLAVPFYKTLKPYQIKRISVFMNPELDPQGSGYHSLQSRIAVGSGMLSGKGYLKGTQTQLSFLPEQSTDFIFSVLAEEWGFIGSSLAILSYLLILIRLLILCFLAQDFFAKYCILGVTALLFLHVVINIGMVIGVLPVVGITLPLISFGGSSALVTLASLGLATSLSKGEEIYSNFR